MSAVSLPELHGKENVCAFSRLPVWRGVSEMAGTPEEIAGISKAIFTVRDHDRKKTEENINQEM